MTSFWEMFGFLIALVLIRTLIVMRQNRKAKKSWEELVKRMDRRTREAAEAHYGRRAP